MVVVFFNYFMYLFLAVPYFCCCMQTLSSCGAGFLLGGSSCCRVQALKGLRWMWSLGLVVPQHVESAWTGDWTYVPYLGKQILYHWTNRDVLVVLFLKIFKEPAYCSPYSGCQFPPTMQEVLFSTPSPEFFVCRFFKWWLFWQMWGEIFANLCLTVFLIHPLHVPGTLVSIPTIQYYSFIQ